MILFWLLIDLNYGRYCKEIIKEKKYHSENKKRINIDIEKIQ